MSDDEDSNDELPKTKVRIKEAYFQEKDEDDDEDD